MKTQRSTDRQCICTACFSYIERNENNKIKMSKAEKYRVYRSWLYLFVGSFFLGIIIMNMGNEVFLGDAGIFNTSTMNRLKYIDINDGKFLAYVLCQRLGGCAVLLILSTTALGLISVYGVVLWQGMVTGMLITAAVIRYGIKGLLLILGGMFPHQCLLIPGGIMLLGWCLENYYWFHRYGRGTVPYFRSRRQQFFHQGILLLWILLVMLIGCVLESYVNPILISDLVKIF